MMIRKLFLLVLFFYGIQGFAQIETLPYNQSFDAEFTIGNDVMFIPNWNGNVVAESTRIFRETTDFNSAPAALSVIPTGSFDGQVIVDLNLLNYSNTVVSFLAKSMANGDGTRPTRVQMTSSIDNGVTWSEATIIGEFPNENQDNFESFTYNLPANTNASVNVKVRFSFLTGTGGTGTRAKVIVDNVVISGDETIVNDPVLTLSATDLNFSQTFGAPSDVQEINVFGANLTEDVVFTVTEPFEIATVADGIFDNTQTLSPVAGDLNAVIFVRLNSMTTGDFTSTLSVSTPDVSTTPEVNLAGICANALTTNPTPYNLSSGNYEFNAWSGDAASGTYPAHMIFWTHATTDPDFNTDFIEDYSCAYNLLSRSRIVGEGDNGVSFVNTGNSQFVGVCDGTDPDQASGETIENGRNGAAVIALNTTGRQNVNVQWTGRTIAPNNRIYALRLQYRIGDGQGNPNINWVNFENNHEYVSQSEAGQSEDLSITLPEEANNEAVVQLRWIYAMHESNTATGSRAHLALDDIIISSEPFLSVGDFESQNGFAIYPNPASDKVYFSQAISCNVYDITGKLVLMANQAQSIDIQNLTKGVYIIKTAEGVSKKLIVK